MSWMTPAIRYGCSVRGQCERDDVNGTYWSLRSCNADCKGAESADLIYLILSYDWELATIATPADQQYLLYQQFGLRVSPAEAVRVVELLAKGHIYELLLTSPVFEDYLSVSLSDFTLFALEVVFLFSQVVEVTIPDWQAFEQDLRSRGSSDDSERTALSIAAMMTNKYVNPNAYFYPYKHPELTDDLYYLVQARW